MAAVETSYVVCHVFVLPTISAYAYKRISPPSLVKSSAAVHRAGRSGLYLAANVVVRSCQRAQHLLVHFGNARFLFSAQTLKLPFVLTLHGNHKYCQTFGFKHDTDGTYVWDNDYDESRAHGALGTGGLGIFIGDADEVVESAITVGHAEGKGVIS